MDTLYQKYTGRMKGEPLSGLKPSNQLYAKTQGFVHMVRPCVFAMQF